jgi:hypothetical protein
MDAALAPLILLALVAGIVSTTIELRASSRPPVCPECPHCRAETAAAARDAEERQRRQQDLQTWYARRNGIEPDDDERRVDR